MKNKVMRILTALLAAVMLLGVLSCCNANEPVITDPSGSTGAHGTEPTDPITVPTAPGTEPTSPGTEPTDPETKPTESATEPSEPETKPTQAETEPTECSHNWSNWATKKAATCTEEGSEERACGKCGEKEQRTAPATGHSYGAWETTEAPTCDTHGVRTAKCSGCGHAKTETVAATGHAWDEGTVTTTPTSCSDMGIRTYTCKACGRTKTEQIKGNHTFGDWYYEEYTFQQTASSGKVYDRISHRKVRVCAACGYKETGGTPDHYCVKECSNHTVTKLEEATCSQKALYRSTCTICGWSTEYRSGAYGSHAWVDETRHLTDYTDYTNELDVTISTCTACGKKYIGYTKGEGFSDYNRYRDTVSVSQGTAYCGAYPVDDDEALLNHPTWQMVYRNFVYDSDGYVKQFTVYWHDTAGNRYSQVIHCGAGEMEAWFADYGVTVPDGYTGGYTLIVSGAQVVPYKIAWAG